MITSGRRCGGAGNVPRMVEDAQGMVEDVQGNHSDSRKPFGQRISTNFRSDILSICSLLIRLCPFQFHLFLVSGEEIGECPLHISSKEDQRLLLIRLLPKCPSIPSIQWQIPLYFTIDHLCSNISDRQLIDLFEILSNVMFIHSRIHFETCTILHQSLRSCARCFDESHPEIGQEDANLGIPRLP